MTVRERLRRVSRVFIKSPDDGELVSAGSLSDLDLGDESSFRDLEPLNQLPELKTTTKSIDTGDRRKSSRKSHKQRWNARDLKRYLEELKKKEDSDLPKDKPIIDCDPIMGIVSDKQDIQDPKALASTKHEHGEGGDVSPHGPRSGEVRTMSIDTIGFEVVKATSKLDHACRETSAVVEIEPQSKMEAQESKDASLPIKVDSAADSDESAKLAETTPTDSIPVTSEENITKVNDLEDLKNNSETVLPIVQDEESKADVTAENDGVVKADDVALAESSDSPNRDIGNSPDKNEFSALDSAPILTAQAASVDPKAPNASAKGNATLAPNGTERNKQWATAEREYDDFLVEQFVDWKEALHIKRAGKTAIDLQATPTASPQSMERDRDNLLPRKSSKSRRLVSPKDRTNSVKVANMPVATSAGELAPLMQTTKVKRSLSRKLPTSAVTPTETNASRLADPAPAVAKDTLKPSAKVVHGDAGQGNTGGAELSKRLTRVDSCKRASKRLARRLIVKFSKVSPPTV